MGTFGQRPLPGDSFQKTRLFERPQTRFPLTTSVKTDAESSKTKHNPKTPIHPHRLAALALNFSVGIRPFPKGISSFLTESYQVDDS